MADLPEPPLRVLAKPAMFPGSNFCFWAHFINNGNWLTSSGGVYQSREITVIPHPMNDPEAVKIIESAKARKC